MKKNKRLLKLSFVAMLAAAICLGGFLKIPLGPVPIVLQNALCILSALLLGKIWGVAPTALFLLAGFIGLPVYSGGTSGLMVWAGPTGGFLPGYLLGALVAGLIAGQPQVAKKKNSLKWRLTLAVFSGLAVIYLPGMFHFARWSAAAGQIPMDKTVLAYTLAACVIPYLPGDFIKALLIIGIAWKVRPLMAGYLYLPPKKEG